MKKDDAEGFTLIGSGVLDAVDPARLEAALAEELAKIDVFMGDDDDWPGPPLRVKHSVFLCWDSASRCPSPLSFMSGGATAELDPASVDGALAEWTVQRYRLAPPSWESPA